MNIELDPDEQKLKDDVLFLAGGDLALGLDLLVRCHAVSCDRISAGYTRAGALSAPRHVPKPRVKPLDIPQPGAPQAANPNS